MNCERPCYTQPRFDYPGMACFLENNMSYADTGMKVVVMIKDKYNPGSYKYVEKPVLYFIPTDPFNSSTVVAYVSPGHDNSYNYMYLLSKRLKDGYNKFAGDHFTMGLKNGEQFDLHYTSYDYAATKARPTYLYYNLLIDGNTSPSDITGIVCSTRINNKFKPYDDTLTERCYFFDNLMKYVHNNTYCEKQFVSQFKTHTYSNDTLWYGGRKQKSKKSQNGGYVTKEYMNINKIDQPFRELIQILEEKIGNIPNLDSIELHNINDDKGIITYCLNSDNVESVTISVNGVEEQTGPFMTYYSLPFDFSSYEFISVEELAQSIDKTISVKPNKMRLPLKNLVLCDDRLDYGKIIEMTKSPMSNVKACRNTRFQTPLLNPPTVQVSSGGKSKVNKYKPDKVKKSKLPKSIQPLTFS